MLQKLLVGLGLLAMIVGMAQLYINVQKRYTPVATRETIRENNTTKKYSLNIEYPQFTTAHRQDQEANNAIKTLINKTVTNFRLEMEESANIPGLSGELFIRYKVIQATGKIISVWFTIEDMQPGYAHPNNYNLTFNYDIEREKILTLRDVFNTQTDDYLAFISEYTSKQLTEEDKKQKTDNSFFIQTGLAPRIANFEKFVMGNNSITFIFDPGQAGPYVVGTRTVSIPMDNMFMYLKSFSQ